jgi:hypothetical protein
MKNLFKALANFQNEVPVILKDTQAYGYKYADLPAVFTVINPLLKKHGIGFTQLINGMSVKTIVFHIDSSEQIESNTDIPQGVTLKGMNDFQVLGSAITYIRRYALSSILGLVTDKDTDASGEQAPPSNEEKKKALDPQGNEKKWLNFETKAYKGTYEKMLSGATTLAEVKEWFLLSKEVETALKTINQ